MGRWDFLADQEPQELRDFVLDRVADQLAAELRTFPPPGLEWEDGAELERFREVLERASPPPLETFRVALAVARLELLHEVERIDRFWSSPLPAHLLGAPLEERTAHFLVRFVTESALSFQEWTQGKFKRHHLVSLVERLEERMLRGYRLDIATLDPQRRR